MSALAHCRLPLCLGLLLLLAPLRLTAQAPPAPVPEEPPAESPIPSGPPPKYEIEADPEALRQAAEEAAAAGDSSQAVEVVRARMADEPGSPAVIAIDRLGPGARPEISRQGDQLAFDRPGEGGLRAVYTSRLDGSSERCLTCSVRELAGHHAMAPTWNARGDLLVLVGQQKAQRLAMDERTLASPARGLHSELWAITRDGLMAWQLTRAAQQGHAVGDPVFSHEGGLLAWSERWESEPAPWGAWGVQVGELKMSGGVPRLGKVDTFDPSPFGRFVQVAGFTPDDHGLLLIVEREDGRRALGRYDLRGKTFELLSRDEDEVTAASELPLSEWSLWVTRGEIWLVSPSGRGRERLSTFGEPASRYYLGKTEIVELAAGPDGKTLVVDLFEAKPAGSGGTFGPPRQSLFKISFDLSRLGRSR